VDTFQRLLNHSLDAGVIDRAWRASSGLISQPINPTLDKTSTPLANRHRGHPQTRRDHLVLLTCSTTKYYPCSQRERLCCVAPRRQ
jgi:hypothetical protein